MTQLLSLDYMTYRNHTWNVRESLVRVMADSMSSEKSTVAVQVATLSMVRLL